MGAITSIPRLRNYLGSFLIIIDLYIYNFSLKIYNNFIKIY